MNDTVLLEWTYSPTDYLEEPIEIVQSEYSLTINEGKAKAKIDSAIFDSHPSMRLELHNELYNRLLAMQLIKYKAFQLSSSAMVRVHPDGRKHIFLEGKSVASSITFGAGDIRIADKNGKIIVDTKRERIEKAEHLASLLIVHEDDATLKKMKKSFDAAIHDLDNELVHLYEIRDAIKSRFGGEKKAITTLAISRSQYKSLGELCNDLPLRQGRHRGKALEGLRDATQDELTEARDIARTMIEAYLQFLHEPVDE